MLRAFMVGQFHWWFIGSFIAGFFIFFMFEARRSRSFQEGMAKNPKLEVVKTIALGLFAGGFCGAILGAIVYGAIGSYYNLGR